jgi:hypothetical protein
MKKLIDFKKNKEAVQEYADEHCEGNFNLAVRQLIRKGLRYHKETPRKQLDRPI